MTTPSDTENLNPIQHIKSLHEQALGFFALGPPEGESIPFGMDQRQWILRDVLPYAVKAFELILALDPSQTKMSLLLEHQCLMLHLTIGP